MIYKFQNKNIMKTILQRTSIRVIGVFLIILLMSFSNSNKPKGVQPADMKYARIVFKVDTAFVSNKLNPVNYSQIYSNDLYAVFREFGISDIVPVFKNRYDTYGQLKKEFINTEKESWFLFLADLKDSRSIISKLNLSGKIITAYIEQPIAAPCDTSYAFSFGNNQWFLNRDRGINVEDAWNINRGRSDVIIAVCDGGVDYTHPNLDPGDRSRVISGYDTGSNDNDPMDDLPDGGDSFANHGTHIAGIIGANPTTTHSISGVMQNCKIMPVKVVGSGGIKKPFTDVYLWDFSATAFPSDIADGIDYAVNNGAHIINLSIGFWFPNIPLASAIAGLDVLVSAINNAYYNNVLVVASMGNEGDKGNPDNFPAKLSHVLAVGNTNNLRVKAASSSTGSHISVCAPGMDILSTIRGGGIDTKNGTSMAAPVVCGVAGLIISQGKDRGFNLTNDDVRQIIERTADDIGTAGFDNETGHGIVNAFEALSLLDEPNELVHGVSYGGNSVKLQTYNKWIVSSVGWGLSAGTYLSVDQYEITKHITFNQPFINSPKVWIRNRESASTSFANPNDLRPYVQISNITNTGFDIRYAVYYVRTNSMGQILNKWIPSNISSTKIAYTAVGELAPTLSGPSTFCDQATYEITNLSSNLSVSWHVEREYMYYIDYSDGTPYWANETETYSGSEITLYSSYNNMPERYNITATITNSAGISILQFTKKAYSGMISQYAHTLDWDSPSIAGSTSYNGNSPQYLNLYANQTTAINFYSVSGSNYMKLSPDVYHVSFDGDANLYAYNSGVDITPSNNSSGYRNLHVIFDNGCGYPDYDHGFTIPCYVNSSGYYSLSPNPATDFIEISTISEINTEVQNKSNQVQSSKDICTVKIFDKFGIMLISEEYGTGLTNVQIAVSHLTTGYYSVVISDGEHTETKKLVVK